MTYSVCATPLLQKFNIFALFIFSVILHRQEKLNLLKAYNLT